MKIVGLGGSLRPESLTYQALQLAAKKIGTHQVATEVIDLRKLHLPFCDGSPTYPDYPDVEHLRETIRSSTGLLLATPEYHGNMSGVLKNALDLLDEDDISGKVIGLMAIVGGVHSTNALNTMRLICRQLHCWVLPEQIVIPYSEESFDGNGELIDKNLEERLDQLVKHLVTATRKLV